MRKSIPSSHSPVSSTRILATLFSIAVLLVTTAGCSGEESREETVGQSRGLSVQHRGQKPQSGTPMSGHRGEGPAAEGMGGDGSGPEQFRELAPIDPGLHSDGQCLWIQSCGESSQGNSCGVCEDKDPCTLDRCVEDFTCVHDPVDSLCPCEPSCGEASMRLQPVTSLNHASGGLPGLEGVQGIAVTADDRHVYVAATESGMLTHLVRVDGTLRWAESLPLGPVVAVAVATDGKAVYTSSSQELRVLARDKDGRLTPTAEKLPPAWGIATEGTWLAAMDAKSLRLYRRGGEQGTTLELLQVIDGPLVAGARQAAFSPGGKHLYTAGFDDSVLAAWEVSGEGLEKISALTAKPGLLNVDSVAVSPDGLHVYAAGFCDHTLAILRRDPESGGLKWTGSAEPRASVQGCVPGMYADQGGHDRSGGPFATPTSIAVSTDNKTVVVTSLSTWFNIRIYKREGDHLAMSMHLDASPRWLDYSRFDWANEEVDGEGPPMPTKPWLYRTYSQVVAGKGRFYISNGIVDALAEMDSSGATKFVQKGSGGLGNLAGAYNMDISPDGKHVYVAPRGSSGVAVGSFASDNHGRLTALPFPVKQLEELGEGAVLNVAVTRPEGRYAAVVEADHPTLYLYERDQSKGTLSEHDQLPIRGCSGRPSFPVDVISTPGGHLYVADFQWEGDGCVHHFRLGEDGSLEHGKTYAGSFLRGVEAIVVSKDGKHLYTACHEASTVAHFARDPSDGTLQPREPIERADLHGAEFIAISPDDRHIYATSPVEDNVVVLARDLESGVLRHLQTVAKQPGAPLKGASGITMTADGTLVFVASRTDDSITILERAQSGRLTAVGSLVDRERLDWVNGVAVSSDGRILYTAAVQSNAISSFLILRDREDGCGGTCP